MIEINKTDEVSKAPRLYPSQIVDIIMIPGIIFLILYSLYGTISNGLEIASVFSWSSGFGPIPESEQAEFISTVQWFFLWGIIFSLLTIGKMGWTAFPFGDDPYAIGYAIFLGQPTKTIVTWRIAPRLRFIYEWGKYDGEFHIIDTRLDNLTTQDDSTVSARFFMLYRRILEIRAAVIFGLGSVNTESIESSAKGLSKQHAALVARKYTSDQLMSDHSLLVKGIVTEIARLAGKELSSQEIAKAVQSSIEKLSRITPQPGDMLSTAIRILAEDVVLVYNETEINKVAENYRTKITDGILDMEEALLKIAGGAREKIPETTVLEEANKLTTSGGCLRNWAVVVDFLMITAEIARNPKELDAALRGFDRGANVRTMLDSATSLSEALKDPAKQDAVLMLLASEGKAEIIVTKGDTDQGRKASLFNFLNKNKR